ncbi:MAG: ATP-dependent DNA helicase [Gammaproteobacteria bacterium]|nr:ATP-dependent DNA helicase [Gammaproteobacteria bacterium]
MKETYKLSVTELADFSCKTGDLDFSGVIGPSAREGIRAHQAIQSRILKANPLIESEVTVKRHLEQDGSAFTITGRVDLLARSQCCLTEIKTTLVPPDRLSDSQTQLHWAQAQLYGYLIFVDNPAAEDLLDPETVQLEILYANLRAETETVLTKELSINELRLFFEQAIDRYLHWIRQVNRINSATYASAQSLSFPHTQYRLGQRDMAAAVFRSTRDQKILLCEAPTGIGKTISSLFPAIKAIGERQISHVTYLTAKNSGVKAAYASIELMQTSGLTITAIMLRSKQLSCFCFTGHCERDESGQCPMTVGFFDRLPDARSTLLDRGVVTGEMLDSVALEHKICPFELALQMLPWVSVAVCDYNYVYDPLVRLSRFSEKRKDTLVLIDEAHNLIDRSRSMFSADLSRLKVLDWVKQEYNHPSLVTSGKKLADAMLKTGNKLNLSGHQIENIDQHLPKNIHKANSQFIESYAEAMQAGPASSDAMFELFKACCRYAAISELFDDQHRVITRVTEIGKFKEVTIELKCLDAARSLQKQFEQYRATVLLSATLTPPEFFQQALGLGEEAIHQKLASPFLPEQSLQLLVSHINTRFRHRENSLEDLVALIGKTVLAKPGNYIVFFPSYAYLQMVHERFVEAYPDCTTWCQRSDSDRGSQLRQLQELEDDGERVGFAIMGGVFGEGVDYIGDRLIGLIVVGVGLPGQSSEQDLIADYYRSKGFDGYDYAYRFPGFTRVMQTVGRLIRHENDRGIVVLVDDRFTTSRYQSLFPEHWNLQRVSSTDQAIQLIQGFWSKSSVSGDSLE